MNKKIFLTFGMFALLLVSMSFFVSAPDVGVEVCCEETVAGRLCQDVPEEQCVGRTAETICDKTGEGFCGPGTCVDTDKGLCMANTPFLVCVAQGGDWKAETKEDIAACQEGCCFVDEGVAFVTQTECKQIASDYGIDVNFNPGITEELTCKLLASPKEKGACVLEEETTFSKDCEMATREVCLKKKWDFRPKLLCTATGLSDCAQTTNTQCVGDKVYYEDSCGNIANIYDSSKKDDVDYWTEIKEEADCSVANNQAGCGDCEFLQGSTCAEYKRGDENMVKPEFGDNVCRTLKCEYDTNGNDKIDSDEKYEHGEAWCAESEGVFSHIQADLATQFLYSNKNEVGNPEKYNVPGSKYYKLLCWDGEVTVEPCDTFRNEVCKEDTIGEYDFRDAVCVANNWRPCIGLLTQDSCNDLAYDCQWIPGYTFQKGANGEPQVFEDELREEQQGSCVPLYAPGFDFWNPETNASSLCEATSVQERVLYETWWGTQRDKFADSPTIDAAQRCYGGGCYAIPEYGLDSTTGKYVSQNKLKNTLWEGLSMGTSLETLHISLRRGYYCSQETDPTKAKLGKNSEDTLIKCIGNADKDGKGFIGSFIFENIIYNTERNTLPLFYTHEAWLQSITARSIAMGDCGYKENIKGVSSSEGSEIISAIFQKLNQDGTPKDNGTYEEIYQGNDYTADNYRIGESAYGL
ncbi:hypothetical protein HOD29_03585 [archaeon]|jgi:hypothetical protein|nr:hypothetical protein [archaeon]